MQLDGNASGLYEPHISLVFNWRKYALECPGPPYTVGICLSRVWLPCLLFAWLEPWPENTLRTLLLTFWNAFICSSNRNPAEERAVMQGEAMWGGAGG